MIIGHVKMGIVLSVAAVGTAALMFWVAHKIEAQQPVVIKAEIGVNAELEVDAIFSEAHQLETEGRQLAALTVYQRVLSEYPGSSRVAEALLAIGDIEFHHNDAAAHALKAYEKALSDHPNSPQVAAAKLGKASCLIDLLMPDAYEALVDVTENHADSDAADCASVWRMFMEVAQEKYTYEEAIEHYRVVARQSSSERAKADAQYAIVGSYFWMGKNEAAIREIEELLASGLYKSRRSLAIVHDMAAILYNGAEDYENAARHADIIVRRYPKSQVIESAKAIRSYAEKKIAEAEDSRVSQPHDRKKTAEVMDLNRRIDQ